MAENKNSIVTKSYRTALAKLAAGEISPIPPVTHLVLGDGGVNDQGKPVPPSVEQEVPVHEVCRYGVVPPTFPEPTTSRFSITIPKGEQTGVKISEMALANANGLVAIKSMYIKQKDDDVEFTLTFDLEF